MTAQAWKQSNVSWNKAMKSQFVRVLIYTKPWQKFRIFHRVNTMIQLFNREKNAKICFHRIKRKTSKSSQVRIWVLSTWLTHMCCWGVESQFNDLSIIEILIPFRLCFSSQWWKSKEKEIITHLINHVPVVAFQHTLSHLMLATYRGPQLRTYRWIHWPRIITYQQFNLTLFALTEQRLYIFECFQWRFFLYKYTQNNLHLVSHM